MKDLTKQALGDALRKLLAEKPLNKITISDITKECGCNRMTFYYHFHDIYELVEWVFEQEAERALEGKITLEGWQDGLRNVFARLQENKALVMNIHRNANLDVLEPFLHRLAKEPLETFVQEIAGGREMDEEDAQFFASFVEYGLLGMLRDWIDKGMKGDTEMIIARFGMLVGALTQLQESLCRGRASIKERVQL